MHYRHFPANTSTLHFLRPFQVVYLPDFAGDSVKIQNPSAFEQAAFREACQHCNHTASFDQITEQRLILLLGNSRMVLLLLLLSSVAASFAAVLTKHVPTSNSVVYEPYTILKRDKLVGLFGFDEDMYNVVPLRTTSLDG
jgi:hypothetical protein